MYAIVEIKGSQLKVEKGQKVIINRMQEEEGNEVTFDRVLLVANDDEIKVGEPTVEGAKVHAKVESHFKGEKKIIFKKKRRKGTQTKKGHRQALTQIEIEDIVAN